jgi:PAS domain S-box-containing protein
MEELQVAQEELYQQNEELLEARQLVELERLRYQELFESAPDGYLVTDIYGKILNANRRAGQLFNMPQSILIGRLLTMLIAEPDRRAFRLKLTQLPQHWQFAEEVFQLQPRHQEPFDAALTLTPVYARQDSHDLSLIEPIPSDRLRHEVIGWRWLIRDITHRKQLEAAELRSHLAELVNQTLEHELQQRQQMEVQMRQQTEALERANQLKD